MRSNSNLYQCPSTELNQIYRGCLNHSLFLYFIYFLFIFFTVIYILVVKLIPLTNQEVCKVLNEENERNVAFRHANPEFALDNSNIASSVAEIEYFENIYSNMECGLHEYSSKDFNFKRADRYSFKNIFSDNFSNFKSDNPSILIRDVILGETREDDFLPRSKSSDMLHMNVLIVMNLFVFHLLVSLVFVILVLLNTKWTEL